VLALIQAFKNPAEERLNNLILTGKARITCPDVHQTYHPFRCRRQAAICSSPPL